MMYVKIHTSGERFQNRVIVAVCDEDLLGKTICGKTATITATKQFYNGEKHNFEETVEILSDAVNCNLLGEKSVKAGIAAGIIDKKTVIMIGKVPHAQFFSV